MRIVSLNLNHRTHCKAVPRELLDELFALKPDILSFNEFVAGEKNADLISRLENRGLRYVACSKQYVHGPGRFSNQVLVASRLPIEDIKTYESGVDDAANSNILTVQVDGLTITFLRAPAYVRAAEWSAYWQWLAEIAHGDLLLGDLNVDPDRGSSRDALLNLLTAEKGWKLLPAEGRWSYKGNAGITSRLDHVLVAGSVQGGRACYVLQSSVPTHTDHAALCVDI